MFVSGAHRPLVSVRSLTPDFCLAGLCWAYVGPSRGIGGLYWADVGRSWSILRLFGVRSVGVLEKREKT